MLLVFTVSALLGAAPTLASPDFTRLNVTEDTARFCNEHLANQLETHGVRVTTARQISTLIGLERQRQLLGCSEGSSSCMAELAAALGVDGVVLGDLGRLGARYQVNLRVVRANGGAVVATWSRAVSKEDDLLDALSAAAAELAPKLISLFSAGAPVTSVGPPPSVAKVEAVAPATQRVGRAWPLAPTFVAAGLAVVSAVSFGLAAGAHARLVDRALSPGTITDGPALATQGTVTQWLGVGTAIAAGVTLGVNVLLWALSGHDEPVLSLLAPWRSALTEVRP